MKNKHLTLSDRITIEKQLDDNASFKSIAKLIHKDCTTISKEIRANLISRNMSGYGRVFNNCRHRYDCDKTNSVCTSCQQPNIKKCALCKFGCRKNCRDFEEEKCALLKKSPYVCNGCKKLRSCTLTKHIYDAEKADESYRKRLSDSRKGFCISETEIKHLNELLTPLIKEQGQSVHHIYIHHKDEIMMSEKKLYNLIAAGILDVRNIDLPRKVRFRKRRKVAATYKVDKKCLEGRRYEDYLAFMEEHPDMPVVQMDTVEGKKGGSCLLTIHFVDSSFMLAHKREYNDSKSVIEFFDDLYVKLGRDLFQKMFPVILTDNGTEFSNPKAIEMDEDGQRRTHIFYCHPSSPYEKGACEVNHELLRRIVPKGTSLDPYTQKDINRMMSHINSYARAKLNDKSPFSLFGFLFGEHVPELLCVSRINEDDINLTRSLISK